MSVLRHWKQRWDAKAPLVFLKKLKWGDGFVLPGDPVTDEIREKLGLVRLKRWWNGQIIARADQPLPNHIVRAIARRKEETAAGEPASPEITKLGGSWFQVTMPDGEVHKVNGKKALAALVGS